MSGYKVPDVKKIHHSQATCKGLETTHNQSHLFRIHISDLPKIKTRCKTRGNSRGSHDDRGITAGVSGYPDGMLSSPAHRSQKPLNETASRGPMRVRAPANNDILNRTRAVSRDRETFTRVCESQSSGEQRYTAQDQSCQQRQRDFHTGL